MLLECVESLLRLLVCRLEVLGQLVEGPAQPGVAPAIHCGGERSCRHSMHINGLSRPARWRGRSAHGVKPRGVRWWQAGSLRSKISDLGQQFMAHAGRSLSPAQTKSAACIPVGDPDGLRGQMALGRNWPSCGIQPKSSSTWAFPSLLVQSPFVFAFLPCSAACQR